MITDFPFLPFFPSCFWSYKRYGKKSKALKHLISTLLGSAWLSNSAWRLSSKTQLSNSAFRLSLTTQLDDSAWRLSFPTQLDNSAWQLSLTTQLDNSARRLSSMTQLNSAQLSSTQLDSAQSWEGHEKVVRTLSKSCVGFSIENLTKLHNASALLYQPSIDLAPPCQ